MHCPDGTADHNNAPCQPDEDCRTHALMTPMEVVWLVTFIRMNPRNPSTLPHPALQRIEDRDVRVASHGHCDAPKVGQDLLQGIQ